LRPKFKEVLRVKETIMRDRPGPECFICCKQVKRIEWLSFWDSWGACLPSTTTLGPEKRVRWGAWGVNGPVLQRVRLNGHMFFNDYKLCCAGLGSAHVHKHTHTHTHTYAQTHTETPGDGPHPSTSPSHWVIFTQALSPLIGADEGLIGSFFYNTQYLSNGKLREAAWVELMRGFAQIKDLVWACFTEWEKRKVEDIFCVLHIFHLCAGIWKEEGVAKGTQWLLKRWALVRIKGSVLYCLGPIV